MANNTNTNASLVARLAQSLNVDSDLLQQAIIKNCFGGAEYSKEEFFLLLLTAERLGLNPLLGEIWAFKAKSNKVMPLVSVDGWKSIMLRQPDFDGYEIHFSDKAVNLPGLNSEVPEWCECVIYLKGRSHPTRERVYMAEKYVASSPVWKNSPRLMLRHRAMIQAIRFSFANTSGIADENDIGIIEQTEAGVANKPNPAAPEQPVEPPPVLIPHESLAAQVSQLAGAAFASNQWQKAAQAIRQRVPQSQANEALRLLAEERKRLSAQAQAPQAQPAAPTAPAPKETVPETPQAEPDGLEQGGEEDFDAAMMF